MTHQYTENPNKPQHCIECGFHFNLHGPDAICEACPNVGELHVFGKDGRVMALCQSCRDAEEQILLKDYTPPDVNSPEANKRVEEHNALHDVLKKAKEIDTSIRFTADMFNAKTIAIVDIKKAIDDDPTIENKNYKLAEFLKERIEHFNGVIFDTRRVLTDAFAEQKAAQIYMNELANRLRAEEREKLKIADITYDAKAPKTVKPKTIKVSNTSDEKEKIKKLCKELGIQEYTFTLVKLAKKWTVEETGNHFRRMINEGKSMSS